MQIDNGSRALTLCVGEATYEVTRERCVATSPFFKAMLEGAFSEAQQDEIVLEPPAPYKFDRIYAYLLGNAPPAPDAQLLPNLANADYLQMNAVRDPLVRALGRQAWIAFEGPAVRRLEAQDPDVLAHMPNVRDHLGRTSMHHAAAAASLRSARLLLGYGANPMLRDTQGRIPLHHATESGAWYWWDDLLKSFLLRTDELLGNTSRDEAWTARDQLGRSPMYNLVRRGKGRWTRDVMRGLSPDALQAVTQHADHRGDTLLHVAMRAPGGADWSVVSDLLAAGADPFAFNARGETPAHVAARHGPSCSLAAYVVLVNGRWGSKACAKMARMQDCDGHTPVHILAEVGGTLGMVLYGLNILGVQDRAGNTALHVAVERAKGVTIYNRAPCFDQLWKASPHGIQNNAGLTPRRLAEILNVWVPAHP